MVINDNHSSPRPVSNIFLSADRDIQNMIARIYLLCPWDESCSADPHICITSGDRVISFQRDRRTSITGAHDTCALKYSQQKASFSWKVVLSNIHTSWSGPVGSEKTLQSKFFENYRYLVTLLSISKPRIRLRQGGLASFTSNIWFGEYFLPFVCV